MENTDKNDLSNAPHIIVKFRDEYKFPYIDNLEDHISNNGLAPWEELEKDFPGISFNVVYTEYPREYIEDYITKLENLAEANDTTYKRANLLNYFVLEAPPSVHKEELLKAIRQWEIVEFAYIPLDHAPLPDSPQNPVALIGQQGYLKPAPDGLGVEDTWPLAGADGTNVNFIDIERGWLFNHQEFIKRNSTVSAFSIADINDADPSMASQNPADLSHGTSVLGVVRAPDNGQNIIGIAFGANDPTTTPPPNGRVISTLRQSNPSVPNIHNAIVSAANHLGEGDVLLIEVQNVDAVQRLWPVESNLMELNEIKTVVSGRKLIVVEVAGNGSANDALPVSTTEGQNLDTYIESTSGKHIFDRSSSGEFNDSGAILVGSATKSTHERMKRTVQNRESDYGDRVDCYAWGEKIFTAGGPDLNDYNGDFGSTSGASAIIAGAALVVQGVAKAKRLGGNTNGTFTPKELREILGSFDPRTNQPWRRTGNEADPPFGTKSNDPAADLIGVMPDLKKIFTDNTNVFADVYMRDVVGDNGSGTTTDTNFWTSPDIIVRNDRVNDPDIEFGEKSTSRNADPLSDSVRHDGKEKYIYVRVSNRGTAPAAGIKIKVYYAAPSTYFLPGGRGTIACLRKDDPFIVPGGNKMRVAEIVWPATLFNTLDPNSNYGHYCFIAVVESYTDVPPTIDSYADAEEAFHNYVRNNNNVAQRNFNVVNINSPGAIARAGGIENAHVEFTEPAEDEIVLQFFVTGAEFDDLEMRLEIGGDLPQEATIHFEADQGFLRNMLGDDLKVVEAEKELESRTVVRAHLGSPDQAGQYIPPFTFPKDMRIPASLIVHLPEELRTQPYDIFIRQLHEEVEVGRITWRLVPHNKEQQSL